MNALKIIIAFMLILSILMGWSSSAHGQDESPPITFGLAVLSGISIIGVGVYDIATAPSSAERYNESLSSMFLLIKDRGVESINYDFGQPKFSRDALVNKYTLPVVYAAKPNKKLKSPKAAGLWSLSATLIPSVVGLASCVAGGWNNNQTTLTIGLIGIYSGWLLGASAGHWYAKQYSRGWLTVGIRIGLSVVGLLSLAASIED